MDLYKEFRKQKANINSIRNLGIRISVCSWSSLREGRGVGDANFANSAMRPLVAAAAAAVAAAAELVVSHILRRISSSLRTMANCFSSRGMGDGMMM